MLIYLGEIRHGLSALPCLLNNIHFHVVRILLMGLRELILTKAHISNESDVQI